MCHATAVLLQNGKISTVQIATDAFGNALGHSLVPDSIPTAPSPGVRAQYLARAYAASSQANTLSGFNPYSSSEANQDFAREQLRFSAAHASFASAAINPSPVANLNQRAANPPTSAASLPDDTSSPLRPDGFYVDDNGTRHFHVNVAGFTRPDPITQFKAALLNGLDQFGANAVARGDSLSLTAGGLMDAAVETLFPDDMLNLGIGRITTVPLLSSRPCPLSRALIVDRIWALS